MAQLIEVADIRFEQVSALCFFGRLFFICPALILKVEAALSWMSTKLHDITSHKTVQLSQHHEKLKSPRLSQTLLR